MSAPFALRPDLAAQLAALRDPAVRDLAWLLFSPDLLRPQPAAPLADLWASPEEADAAAVWLAALDRDAHTLHRALAVQRLTRLGRYAEELLGWFLLQGPFARLVAANVALQRPGRTLGECDFLVETAGGRRLHWELAVKCYLRVGEGPGKLSDFVGPNLLDRFDRKLARLIDHQLRLSAREEFAVLGHPGPWLAQMFVKGWLFYREGDAASGPSHDPAELAPRHPGGWWVTHADWSAFADAQAAAGWSVLPRLDWLAPRRLDGLDGKGTVADASSLPDRTARPSTGIAPPTAPHRLSTQLARCREPVMIAAFATDDDGYRELSRGFVVPDDWPARALAFARE